MPRSALLIAAMTVTTAAAIAAAPSAQAAFNYNYVNVNDSRKAVFSYDSTQHEMCVNTNSGGGTKTRIRLFSDSGTTGRIWEVDDQGGDGAKTCTRPPSDMWGVSGLTLRATWYGSGGNTVTNYIRGLTG